MSSYATGPHQIEILRLLRDGRGRTAAQIANRLQKSVTATSERLRQMSEPAGLPPMVKPLPPKPPRRGRVWKLTHLGREHIDHIEHQELRA